MDAASNTLSNDEIILPPGRRRRPEAHLSLYTELSRQVQARGLHRRRYGYYWAYFAAAVAALVAIWAGVVLLGDSWWQLGLAALMAFVLAQLGFLGHDAAHRQIFRSAAWNEWSARVISGLLVGLSYGWWVSKHNRHHSGPNQVDRDPDIAPGALALTPEIARARTGRFSAAFTRRQGWWFFVLLPLEGLSLHIQGFQTVLGRAPVRRRRVEQAFLFTRFAGYVAALLLLMPWHMAAAFLAVQLAVFGVLLGGAFAPNHIGMPIVAAGARPDFLRRQVLMSRNITGGAVVGLMMGGLNHQIEHHLFPNMPRPGLKRARRMVRDYCRQHQVGYTEVNAVEAFTAVVKYLNVVGLKDADAFRCPMVTLYR